MLKDFEKLGSMTNEISKGVKRIKEAKFPKLEVVLLAWFKSKHFFPSQAQLLIMCMLELLEFCEL